MGYGIGAKPSSGTGYVYEPTDYFGTDAESSGGGDYFDEEPALDAG